MSHSGTILGIPGLEIVRVKRSRGIEWRSVPDGKYVMGCQIGKLLLSIYSDRPTKHSIHLLPR
jgi:hypothetical protein